MSEPEKGAPDRPLDRSELAAIVEALLFATDVPLSLERMRAALPDVEPAAIREAFEGLRERCEAEGRGFTLRQVSGGWQLASHPRYAEHVARLFRGRPRMRLSRPALETLAIISYRQPVTRAEIEAIRGVNADAVLRTLLERRLVTVTGRKEVPGRPLVFGTTREFLAYFGLNDLRDLPEERELEGLLDSRGEDTAAVPRSSEDTAAVPRSSEDTASVPRSSEELNPDAPPGSEAEPVPGASGS